MEEMLAKVGLKGVHIITGLIGGSIGLFFGKTLKTVRDKVKAFFVVLAGSVVTGYITPLIMIWFPNWESAEYSIAFFMGLMGMGVVEGLVSLVTKFKTKPVETIKEIKEIARKE
tara:strand:- start:472 stop:813 length:342 start_codon:yes stop_codon:yes gene_type:complete